MIGIVLEQFRKIENSSRTLEHVFAEVELLYALAAMRRPARASKRRLKADLRHVKERYECDGK